MRKLLCLLICAAAAFAVPSWAVVPASSQSEVVEFYNKALDHYFITADPKEAADLDNGVHAGWTRTGYKFQAITAGVTTQPGSVGICRFYGKPSAGLDSHFYAATATECAAVVANFPDQWVLESNEVFRAFAVSMTTGQCPSDTEQIYRLWNKRADVNHRYTDQLAVFQAMKDKGYQPEGNGDPSLPVVFCLPVKDSASSAPSGTPACTLSAPSVTPAVGSLVTLTATCTQSPTSYTWTGCTSTTSTCTTSADSASVVSYSLIGTNSVGAGNTAKLDLSWQSSAGALSICTISGTTNTPAVGGPLALSGNCSQTPTRYDWMECSYLQQSACKLIATCSQSSKTCTVSATVAGFTHYALAAANASGVGARAGYDAEWKGSSVAPPPGNSNPPVCAPGASNASPTVGTSILIFAGCTNNPTQYTWSGCNSSADRCPATSSVAGVQTYTVTASNGGGTTTASVQVNWGGGQAASPPVCTVSPSNATPLIGTTIVLTASCSGSPTSYLWAAGCTPNANQCSATASAAGMQSYGVQGTNDFGTGQSASAQVDWQTPPTSPPGCTVAASTTSPFIGQPVTLTATCSNQPIASSYVWTNCSSSTSTCIATSQTVSPQNYDAKAANSLGTGAASPPVTLNWQQSQGGADFCGSYSGVLRGSADWHGTHRVLSANLGNFQAASVAAISFVVPNQASGSFQASVVEYVDAPTARHVTLSRNACDFRDLDPTGVNGPLSADPGAGPSQVVGGSLDTGQLTPGQTYYINVRNWSIFLGNTCTSGYPCNFAIDYYW